MRRSRADARDLLQKAADQPLSEVEKLRLQAYEATDEGLVYREIHSYLQNEMPGELSSFRLNRHKLKAVASHIEERAQRKRQVRRVVYVLRSAAMVTAVLLMLFFALNWITNREFIPEPVANLPDPMTQSTPTVALASRMKYVNLETAAPELLQQLPPVQYGHPLLETAEEAGFDLLVPTQLDADVTFVGSMFNEKQNAAEIVLRNSIKVAHMYRLWFLIQSPLDEARPNQSLPLSYQVPWSKDAAGTKAIAAETVALGRAEGIYEGYDLMYTNLKHSDMVEVISVRSLSWQHDNRQLTLTVVSPNSISAERMRQMIEKWHLVPYAP